MNIENTKGFIKYFKEKINANKEILSLVISLVILVQTLFFLSLDNISKIFFKTYYIIFAIIIFIILIIFFIGIVAFFYNDKYHNSYNELNDIEAIKCPRRDEALKNQTDYMKKMQIFLLDDIEKIEKNIENDEQIWVLTSDVKLETTNSSISKTMKKNLRRGVAYKYFIPDTVKNRASIMELKRKYKEYSTFSIVKTASRYRLLFERFDVIIYSPDTDRRIGFICVNFSEKSNLIAFKKFSDDDTRIIIGLLENIERA